MGYNRLMQSKQIVSPPMVATKGLLNGPGQNNCFLNCAVQVSIMLMFYLFSIHFSVLLKAILCSNIREKIRVSQSPGECILFVSSYFSAFYSFIFMIKTTINIDLECPMALVFSLILRMQHKQNLNK